MFNKSKTAQEPMYDILSADASFELKEAYNSLCTNVLYASNNGKLKKLAVTSSVYGEGKTAVAINLAFALACNLIDKKILLIDADLRTPHVADLLKSKIAGSPRGQGLSDFLVGKCDFPNVAKTEVENLDVICAGDVTLNPAGLLKSLKMKEFLDKCAELYDYVIIDTPPLNIVSDALLLIGRVDGYIVGAKTNFSKAPMLDATQESLASVGANILGIVLTDAIRKN